MQPVTAKTHRVKFEPVGIEIEVSEDETVLEGGFRSGLMLMHGCKEGQCSACKSFLIDGEIDLERYSTFALADYEKEEGYTLLCRAHAYSDLVVEFAGLKMDNNIRQDTTPEKLAKLRPTFDPQGGTLTAGNSTPLTDGSSAVLLASEEWAAKRNLPVLAYLSFGKAWAVDYASGNEGLLMAPAHAVPAMLQDAGLSLQDFDYYEIHEAFAAQVLCTLKAWESPEYCRDVLGLSAPLGSIDRSKLNVKGGSIAIGHPFAATGTRIVSTLAKILANDPNAKRGLISACTAGGMGVTAIVER